jgi:hypothetical protein
LRNAKAAANFDSSEEKTSYLINLKNTRSIRFQDFMSYQSKIDDKRSLQKPQESPIAYIKISEEEALKQMEKRINHSVALRNGQVENPREPYKTGVAAMRAIDLASQLKNWRIPESGDIQHRISKINVNGDTSKNSDILKQRLADLLEESHLIMKNVANMPQNSKLENQQLNINSEIDEMSQD